MKIVELEIKKNYKVKVLVKSESGSESDIITQAEEKADNMDHNHWEYRDTEFDAISVIDAPSSLTRDHIILMECGYPYERVKKYSIEEAEGELEAINFY
ncbi:MAG: hypothetical protein ACQEWU_10240 [Bacillota bacterium]